MAGIDEETIRAAQKQAVRDLMRENFGEAINRIADETVGAKLAEVEAAVRADERRRIRELADRTQAVCTGDEGTSHFFSALLEDQAEGARVTAMDGDEPLTHFFHCWRFPDHHRCAVALIERQSEEYDQLLVRAAAPMPDGQRAEDQPLPKPGTGPHDLACADIRIRWGSGRFGSACADDAEAVAAGLEDRKRLGLERYGQLLQANNGRNALRDLLEEVEDATVYCRQVIEEDHFDRETRDDFKAMYEDLIRMLFRLHWARRAFGDPSAAGEAP